MGASFMICMCCLWILNVFPTAFQAVRGAALEWTFEETGEKGFWDTSHSVKAELVGSGGQTGGGALSLNEGSFLRIKRKTKANSCEVSAVSFWIKNEGSIQVELFADKNSEEAYIKVNEVSYSSRKQGRNYIIVDYDTGRVLFAKGFNGSTSNDTTWEWKIPPRSIILSTIASTGSCLIEYNGLETVSWLEQLNNDTCNIVRNIPLPVCIRPIGMQNGKIRNKQISASSSLPLSKACFARLGHHDKAWCTSIAGEYIEVDLEEIRSVTFIATQGSPTDESWVSSYYLKYSVDAISWVTYQEEDRRRDFFGNRDSSDSVVMQRLMVPIKTRFIRLYVTRYHPGPAGEACMRMELYGCKKEITDPNRAMFSLYGPTELKVFTGDLFNITGYYRYCYNMSAGNVSRIVYVWFAGNSTCLPEAVRYSCARDTFFTVLRKAPEKPGIYNIWIGVEFNSSACATSPDMNVSSSVSVGIVHVKEKPPSATLRNCWELKRSGVTTSGVYTINPDAGISFDAFCDQSTDGGGWTVVQRRFDGSENFTRFFYEYSIGFGQLSAEFWLGTERIAQLTNIPSELLVELEDSLGRKSFALYRRFRIIKDGDRAYRLSLGYYSGTAGDALGNLDEMLFSATGVDLDKDINDCATIYSSGWWYKGCTTTERHANLNGPYPSGIYWSTWMDNTITRVTMKVRPVKDLLCSEESCYVLTTQAQTWYNATDYCPKDTRYRQISEQNEQDAVSAFFVVHPFIGRISDNDVNIWRGSNNASKSWGSNCTLLSNLTGIRRRVHCHDHNYMICHKGNDLSIIDVQLGEDTSDRYSLILRERKYFHMLGNEPLNRTTSTMALNKWTHIMIIWTRGKIKYFENGKLKFNLSRKFQNPNSKALRVGQTHSLSNYQLSKALKIGNINMWNCFPWATNGPKKEARKGKLCTFEEGMCGWLPRADTESKAVWTIGKGCAPVWKRPSHCLNQTKLAGNYLSLVPVPKSQKVVEASFESPYFTDLYGCLQFMYFIHGCCQNSLSVYVKSPNKEPTLTWTRTRYWDKMWHRATIRIGSLVREISQVVIVGVRNAENRNFVAIDDLSLKVGSCVEDSPLKTDMDSNILRDHPQMYDYMDTWLAKHNIYTRVSWIRCYSAAEHGWDPVTFHEKCDHKHENFFLARTDWEIFGGFTNRVWNKDITGYSRDPSSFLFSLRNAYGLRPLIFPVKKQRRTDAIFNNLSYTGPSFGLGDLRLQGQKGSSHLGLTYSTDKLKYKHLPNKTDFLTGDGSFTLSELEVYYKASYENTKKICMSGSLLWNLGDEKLCDMLEPNHLVKGIHLNMNIHAQYRVRSKFKVTFNNPARSVRYIDTWASNTNALFTEVRRATAFTIQLVAIEENHANVTTQAIGWFIQNDPIHLTPDHYWSLDAVSNVRDERGDLAEGAASNAEYVPGIINQAIQVSGANNSWVNFGHLTCDLDCRGITISLWLRLTDSSSGFPKKLLGVHEVGEQAQGFLIWMEGHEHAGIQFTSASKRCVAFINVAQEMWTHFVFTAADNGIRVYRNGKPMLDIKSECITGHTIADNATDLKTGNVSAVFDEILVWHRPVNSGKASNAYLYSSGAEKEPGIELQVRLIDEEWKKELEYLDSPEFEGTSHRIAHKLKSAVHSNKLKKVDVVSFRNGSVIATIGFVFDQTFSWELQQIYDVMFIEKSVAGMRLEVIEVITSSFPVQSPSNTSISKCNGTTNCLLITWKRPTNDSYKQDFQGYVIFYSMANDSTILTERVNKDTTSHEITRNIYAGATYQVQVAVAGRFGPGLPSAPASTALEGRAPSASPTSVIAVATWAISIHVTWVGIPNTKVNSLEAPSYRVFWKKTNETTFLTKDTTQLGITLLKLEEDTNYTMVVCAFTSFGFGPNSSEVTVKTKLNTAPSASPTNVLAVATWAISIHVTWAGIPGTTVNSLETPSYRVFWKKSNETTFLTNDTTQLGITLLKLEEDTNYTIVICAFTSFGFGPNSSEVTVKTKLNIAPGASPTNVLAVAISETASSAPVNSQSLYSSLGKTNERASTSHPTNFVGFITRVSPVKLTRTGILGTLLNSLETRHQSVMTSLPHSTVVKIHVPAVSPNLYAAYNTSSTSIVLKWHPLPPLPAAQLLGYRATYRKVHGTHFFVVDVSPSDHELELRNLEKFTEYSVSAAGVFAPGIGPGSEELNVTTGEDVPSEPPINVTAYPQSSTVIKVTWLPVPSKSLNGITRGYRVFHRRNDSNETFSVVVGPHSLSVDLPNLRKSCLYVIAVLAFTVGEGPVSKEITVATDEDIPERPPPFVWAESNQSPYSINVQWQEIPAQYCNGVIRGYRFLFIPVSIAGQLLTEKQPVQTVTTVNVHERQITLTGLESFTRYTIQVVGFTAKGDGPHSDPVEAETCRCPDELHTNWWHYPPYLQRNNESGVFPFLLMRLTQSCCKTCANNKLTRLNFSQDGNNNSAEKSTSENVRDSINHDTHLSFPITGYLGQDHYARQYGFVAIVQSPGTAFLVYKEDPIHSGQRLISSSLYQCWPVLVVNMLIAILSGMFVWFFDSSSNQEDFPRPFLRGVWQGTWWAFITMTTVGYGDKTPKSVMSRLFAVASTMIGLVTVAFLSSIVTSSLTVVVISEEVKLYGTKVAAVKNSPEFRLGLRKNAKMNTDVEYNDLEEVQQAIIRKEVQGALIDLLVAGSRKDLFENESFRLGKVLASSTVYGVVLAGDAKKLQKCFQTYIKENAEEFTRHIEKTTPKITKASATASVEQAMNLFHAENPLFLKTLWWSGGVLVLSTLLGIIFNTRRKLRNKKRITPGGMEFKRHKIELQCVLGELVKELHTSVRRQLEVLRQRHNREIRKFLETKKVSKQGIAQINTDNPL